MKIKYSYLRLSFLKEYYAFSYIDSLLWQMQELLNTHSYAIHTTSARDFTIV